MLYYVYVCAVTGGEDQGSLISDDRKKRPRTAFTAAQIKALEGEFEKNKYLSVSKRMQLSKHLKLTETQVAFCILTKIILIYFG